MTIEVVNELTARFGTTVEHLIPAMQQYELRMHMIGIVILTVLIILTLLGGLAYILLSGTEDSGFVFALMVVLGTFLITCLILAVVDYFGWKYNAEIRFFKYVFGR